MNFNKDYIMIELNLYMASFGKILIGAKSLLCTPMGLIVSVPTTAYFTLSNDLIQAWYLLGISFFVDFCTGIYASYIENKKAKQKKGELFIQNTFLGKVMMKIGIFFDTITSEKLRKSVVKGIAYLLFILLVYAVEKVFFIKSFNFFGISDKKWTITLVTLAFCTSIEIYSAIFENLKKAGYDLSGAFIKTIKGYKEVKKELDEE